MNFQFWRFFRKYYVCIFILISSKFNKMTEIANNDESDVRNKLGTLNSMLSKYLKLSHNYILFNFMTTKKSVPVIYKPKDKKPLLVTKTTHFCVLFTEDKVPLLAIEVFTYCTFYKDKIERLIYVSKADTTGLPGSKYVNVGKFVTQYLKWICNIPIEILISKLKIKKPNQHLKQYNNNNNEIKNENIFFSETQYKLNILKKIASGLIDDHTLLSSHDYLNTIDYLILLGMNLNLLENQNISTKLVLFTRSEGQYLFPESMKNHDKHILDGKLLLKWWLKNINNFVNEWNNCKKFLNVLNSEKREIMKYFPSNDWIVGNVYDFDKDNKINNSELAIYNIPLLPDDPKGRFLEHLVVEGRSKKVKCKQYWQELSIRQEFSFGAIVGLIGIYGYIDKTNLLNNKIEDFNFLKPKNFQSVIELITSKNYSDKSDWGLLYDELNEIQEIKQSYIKGLCEFTDNKRQMDESVVKEVKVNTLLCVKRRKKVKP